MTVPHTQRIPNPVLRGIRLGMRLSQAEFARAVQHAGVVLGEPNSCNKRLIQKWESGEHSDCRPNYQRALCAVTRTPFESLGFSGASGFPIVPDYPAAGAHDLPGLGQTADGVAGDDAASRLKYALAAPVHADAAMVSVAEIAVAQLFTAERGMPARSTVESAFAQLHDLSAMLCGTSRGPLRRRLTTTAGACAAVAGQLTYETGAVDAAERLWDTALAAAQRAGDRPLAACVLAYRSHVVAERGNPEGAWHVTRSALGDAGRDPYARAWLSSLAAKYSAYAGSSARALDEVARALADAHNIASHRASAAPWLRFLDGAYLHAGVAHVYATLGDAHTALNHAQRARQLLGASRTKTRALVLAEIAYAAAFAKDPALMNSCVFEAAELADLLESNQVRNRLRALRQMIDPLRDQSDYQTTALRLDRYAASGSDWRLVLP